MSNAANMRLAFIIEAIDNATAKVRAVNEQIDRQAAPLRRARDAARGLVREAGWERLRGQMDAIRERGAVLMNTVRGIGTALGIVGAAAGAAFWQVKRAVDEVDRANDIAAKLHIPVEDWQRMAYAAQLNGSSAEDLEAAMRKLSLTMIEAVNGSKEQQVWFARMGITMDQLRRMNVTQVWEAIADKFQAVGDAGQNAQKKLAALQAMTGRSTDSLVQLLNLGSAGMRQFYQEADRLGVVIDGDTASAMGDFNDNFDRLSLSLRALMAHVARYALPALDAMLKRFTSLTVAGRDEWARRMGTALGELANQLPGLLSSLGAVASAMAGIASAADTVARALGGWDVVIKGIVALLATKLVVDLVLLFTTIAKAVPTVLAMGKMLFALASGFAAVLAWPAALAAALVGAAVLIWKYWEPIGRFFSGLWERIKGVASTRITYAPAAGAPSIYAGEAAWSAYRAQQQSTQVGGTLRVELADGLRLAGGEKTPGSPLDIDVYRGASFGTP